MHAYLIKLLSSEKYSLHCIASHFFDKRKAVRSSNDEGFYQKFTLKVEKGISPLIFC